MNWWYFIQPIPLSQLLDYSGGTSPIYIGEANPGALATDASWRIKQLAYDGNGNVISILWSPNYNKFGDVWGNRTMLTYS